MLHFSVFCECSAVECAVADVSENSGVKSANRVTCGVKLQREGRKPPRLWSSLIWGPALLALAYSSQHSHKDDKALIKANDWPRVYLSHSQCREGTCAQVMRDPRPSESGTNRLKDTRRPVGVKVTPK